MLEVKRLVAALLAASLAACGGAPLESTASTRAALGKALSGEEVFRGLVFGEGSVAMQFPEVWGRLPSRELTPEQQSAKERLEAQVMDDIRGMDPTFFDRFGADVQSGDHLRIERTMDESAALVKQTLQKRVPEATVKDGAVGACATVVVVVAVAIAANAFAVVNVYGYANVAVNQNVVYDVDAFWGSPQQTGVGSQLGRDEVIDMIATRLAVI